MQVLWLKNRQFFFRKNNRDDTSVATPSDTNPNWWRSLESMVVRMFVLPSDILVLVTVALTTQSEHCGWQGYGIFTFLWQFFIPLMVFVVAYWKILGSYAVRQRSWPATLQSRRRRKYQRLEQVEQRVMWITERDQTVNARTNVTRSSRAVCLKRRSTSWEPWSISVYASPSAGCQCTP